VPARKKKRTKRYDHVSKHTNDELAERLSHLSEAELLAWADDLWAHASLEELEELVQRCLETEGTH